MHTLRSRHHTRQVASVMLYVWLFAMAISWVNVCVWSVDRTVDHHGRGSIVALQGAGQHSAFVASGDREPDAGLKACASFCEAEQNALTKAQSAKGDVSAELSHSLVNVAGLWPAFMPGAAQVRWHPLTGPPRMVIPVVIAFLRLTI